MKSAEAVIFLNNGVLPSPLDYNINHTETIDFQKLQYNNIGGVLYQNKNYKQLLNLPIFKNIIDKEIEKLEKSGVSLINAITYDI